MSASAALRHEDVEVRAPYARPEIESRQADILVLPKIEPALVWRNPADMHKGVYLTALGCWAAFLSVFWITFAGSASTVFMLVVCAVYATVFFSLPVILTRLFPEAMPVKGTFRDFLKSDFSTIDGSISGLGALVQVIVVPACLAVGGTLIGFAIHAARLAH